VNVQGFSGLEIERAVQLHDADLEAVNTRLQPDRVRPSALADAQAAGALASATLAPASWNVIRLREVRR
jgi:alpha-N-arabinofuranosidase